jgi:hypothetical protein
VLVFLSGLFAGSLHVLSGPDHVAAIAPLAMRTAGARRALGAVWGVGHGGGVALWLVLAAFFRTGWSYQLPAEALEALVGVALMALGTFSFFRRDHGAPGVAEARARPGRVAALLLGALHGSAGASHLLALLPTLGLPTPGVVSYAAGYLLAGVLAMAGVAGLLGRLSGKLQGHLELSQLRRGCALLVFALGAVWFATSLRDLSALAS